MTQDAPLPPRDDDPTMEQPRRLTRSTTDKYVGGVSGGLGRYFGLDATLFRVAFGVSIVFGGIGIVAYVALWLFLGTDDGEPSFMESRSRATTVVAIAILGVIGLSMLGPPKFLVGPGLFACVVVVAGGVALYRAVGGGVREDPARAIARGTLVLLLGVAALGAATGVGILAAIGGGTAEAILAVFAGLGLIAAGLLGGPRWLLLPVVVLLLPLAVVSAAGIDLHGGVGHREYRPATVADLRGEYRIGAGDVDLDLRGMELPPGRTNVKLVVGIGSAKVRVPNGVCVSTDAQVGAGDADLPDRDRHGFDLAIADAGTPHAGAPLLHVQADVGLGYLQVDRADFKPLGAACA
jgi:phage shock protein PspC (stress-responsive transcriptional regulator)